MYIIIGCDCNVDGSIDSYCDTTTCVTVVITLLSKIQWISRFMRPKASASVLPSVSKNDYSLYLFLHSECSDMMLTCYLFLAIYILTCSRCVHQVYGAGTN